MGNCMKENFNYSSTTLCEKFIRSCPNVPLYQDRLKQELELIAHFKFEKVFLQVLDILSLSKGIPHVVRGSAGSSLVCYLLGITNIDPVKENISLARFMNRFRSDIPDIDIDFPYNRRDEIILKLRGLYGERVARISNHVTFKESSALREAMRIHGYHRFLPKYFDVFRLLPDKAHDVIDTAQSLLGRFRGYSTHCGGIVIFDEPVKKELLLKQGQLKLDKNQVEDRGLIKIDLLCNRGLAQLTDISKKSLESYPEIDRKTADLFCKGDVLGITFSESPAMMRLVKAIRPKSRRDIALCLALVRPAAASRGKKLSFLKKWQKYRTKTQIVYDDDATALIQHLLKISSDEADFYRRAFAKGDEITMAKFKKLIEHLPAADEHVENLSMMKEYSFCKAHAISYSYLVWALGYWKVHDPKSFWAAALKHCHSMYRPWVHVAEAKQAGLSLATVGPNWHRQEDVMYDPKQTPFLFSDEVQEYQKYGYWLGKSFMPGLTAMKLSNKVRVRGLIATYRRYRDGDKKLTFVTLGSSLGKYWDLVIEGNLQLHSADILDVEGEVKTFFNSEYIKVTRVHKVMTITQTVLDAEELSAKETSRKLRRKN
jgi:DNA polymerase III alpha subunit